MREERTAQQLAVILHEKHYGEFKKIIIKTNVFDTARREENSSAWHRPWLHNILASFSSQVLISLSHSVKLKILWSVALLKVGHGWTLVQQGSPEMTSRREFGEFWLDCCLTVKEEKTTTLEERDNWRMGQINNFSLRRKKYKVILKIKLESKFTGNKNSVKTPFKAHNLQSCLWFF